MLSILLSNSVHKMMVVEEKERQTNPDSHVFALCALFTIDISNNRLFDTQAQLDATPNKSGLPAE